MTDREKAIVMAYTGVCMFTGDKLSVFYEYVESIMGRPVYTHEMGTKVVDNLIKEKARPDFIALCADESSSEKPDKWIPVSKRYPEDGQRVLVDYCDEDAGIMLIRFNVNGYRGFKAWMPLPEPYKASLTGAEGRDKSGKKEVQKPEI